MELRMTGKQRRHVDANALAKEDWTNLVRT